MRFDSALGAGRHRKEKEDKMIIEDELNPKDKVELKPKPNCKYCFGRGYVRVIPQSLDANRFRELRPCSCVKAIVELKNLSPEKIAEQKIIK